MFSAVVLAVAARKATEAETDSYGSRYAISKINYAETNSEKRQMADQKIGRASHKDSMRTTEDGTSLDSHGQSHKRQQVRTSSS